MKLFITATINEAQAVIKKFNAKASSENVYSFNQGVIVISGMGSLSSLKAVLEHGKNATEIYNLGLAGSLNGNLELGQIVEVACVDKYIPFDDPIAKKAFPTLGGQGLKLVTSDFPLHDAAIRKKWAEAWDLVDMEGYGVAFGAKELGKKYRLIKIISDFASENGRTLINQNIEKNAELLAYYLLNLPL